jgi:hypothetical protein
MLRARGAEESMRPLHLIEEVHTLHLVVVRD